VLVFTGETEREEERRRALMVLSLALRGGKKVAPRVSFHSGASWR